MIKQTIKYEDYNGNEQTEDFYFNLTKLEMLEMEINHEGGLSNYIEQLTQTTAGADLYNLFKKIILEAHGRKSPDGRYFWKVDPDTGRKYADDFVMSPAMTELIMSFLEDSNDAVEFVRGLLPAKMVEETAAQAAAQKAAGEVPQGDAKASLTAVSPEPVVTTESEKKAEEYTREELLAMSQKEFDKVAGTNPQMMHPDVLRVAYQRKTV